MRLGRGSRHFLRGDTGDGGAATPFFASGLEPHMREILYLNDEKNLDDFACHGLTNNFMTHACVRKTKSRKKRDRLRPNGKRGVMTHSHSLQPEAPPHPTVTSIDLLQGEAVTVWKHVQVPRAGMFLPWAFRMPPADTKRSLYYTRYGLYYLFCLGIECTKRTRRSCNR